VTVVAAASLQDGETGAAFRPTHLMERTSRYLELETEPVSQSSIEAGVKGNRDGVDPLRVTPDR
jgi:hypothetical protein